MTRKEAMELAFEYYDKRSHHGRNELANLFQEATTGLYRIGEKVDAGKHGSYPATVVAMYSDGGITGNPENVRPLREKRPATKEELALAITSKRGVDGIRDFSLETTQMMARDLGISTEVECE